ncbi:MAG TPA: glutaredoxin family protein [Gammaproteobacteria bacterium]|nr:glutaredoxin family protein [Gammaproteobacteria bacterium]
MKAPLTLYSRAGCHLCDAMLAEVSAFCAGRPVELDVVDVDSSPDLISRYGLKVPVLVGTDGELCHGRLDDEALADYLWAFQ